MLVRVALLALLAIGLAPAGRIVFQGPDNGHLVATRRAALTAEPVSRPRQVALASRRIVATTEGAKSSCPSEPPENATEDTLDPACFALTDELEATDEISAYSALANQCGLGFMRRKRDDKCVRWVPVRVARSKSPKSPK